MQFFVKFSKEYRVIFWGLESTLMVGSQTLGAPELMLECPHTQDACQNSDAHRLWSTRRAGEAKWLRALCCGTLGPEFKPSNAFGHMICKHIDGKGLSAMLAAKRSPGVTIGESEESVGIKPLTQNLCVILCQRKKSQWTLLGLCTISSWKASAICVPRSVELTGRGSWGMIYVSCGQSAAALV